MNKFLKFTLFFVLVSLFISSKVSADSPDDFLKRREISIDSTIDIDVFLEHSKNTTGDSLMPIIFTENRSKYIKLSDDIFFRVVDSSVELISLSSETDTILWKKAFDDLFLPKILIKNNYLIISGEFFSYDFDLFEKLNLSKPISIVKVFDISDLNEITLSKEFLLPGSFKDCISVEDSIMLFTDFISGADSIARFPYYIDGNQKHNFSINNLIKMDNSSSPSYINALKISLSDKPEVMGYKSLLGFGRNLSFSDNSLYARYFENGNTRISKLNLNGVWFTHNHSISVPGIINSDNSFSIFEESLQLVTSVSNENRNTFNVYSLDESLNLIGSFEEFEDAFLQGVYPLKNNLLLSYSDSNNTNEKTWMNFHFSKDNSMEVKTLDNFKYSNSFITDDYIFSFENRDSNELELLIRDNHHRIINTLGISNNDFVFPSGNMIACTPDNKNLVIPIVLNTSIKTHGMLVFQNYTTDSPSMFLISDNTKEESHYSISDTPEFLDFQGNTLFAFSQNSIFKYNLTTKEIEAKIPLR